MKIIYELRFADIPGRENPSQITIDWSRLYTTAKKAQKAAENDYGFTINWREGIGNGPIWNSGNLGGVMYNIREIEVL